MCQEKSEIADALSLSPPEGKLQSAHDISGPAHVNEGLKRLKLVGLGGLNDQQGACHADGFDGVIDIRLIARGITRRDLFSG